MFQKDEAHFLKATFFNELKKNQKSNLALFWGVPQPKVEACQKTMQNSDSNGFTPTNPLQFLKKVRLNVNKRADQKEKLYEKIRLADGRTPCLMTIYGARSFPGSRSQDYECLDADESKL